MLANMLESTAFRFMISNLSMLNKTLRSELHQLIQSIRTKFPSTSFKKALWLEFGGVSDQIFGFQA